MAHFGPMAMTVLEEWGVHPCSDFGNIVFNMIEAGWFAKSNDDRREDFDGGYDFFYTFPKPYLPARRQAAPQPVIAHSWRCTMTERTNPIHRIAGVRHTRPPPSSSL